MKSDRPYEKKFNTAPPFTSEIIDEAIPPRFKMPQTELYDGSTDPLDHLEAFKALMLPHGAADGTLCRAFPATLRKAARQWFSNLHPGSISSFEQLDRLFITHFISSRPQRCTSDTLIGNKQKDGESLREYISRFNAATLEVSDLDQVVAMSAMKGSLRPSRFLFSLKKQFPTNFAEMLAQDEKYANAEEAMSMTSQPEKKEKRRRKEPSSDDRPIRTRSLIKPPSSKFHNYAPLNTS